jgi:methyltransferase (TIGR00027 family)
VSQASRTAHSMAVFRALESAAPADLRLFSDQFAPLFLDRSTRVAAWLARRSPTWRARLVRFIDRRWPGGRTSAVARTALIDRRLERALRHGVAQVAILGAGYDSRAYRISGIEKTRVFEVDRRETQQVKRDRIIRHLRSVPPNVVFVEIDFLRQTLAEVLAARGFCSGRRTFFVWEGVTNYLDAGSVDATLRFVGSSAPGSEIAFTYVHRGLLDGSGSFSLSPNVARLLRRAGEPWTFGFYPSELSSYLDARGMDLMQDLGAIEYGALFMGASPDEMRGYEFYHVAIARVRDRENVDCQK